MVLLAKDRLVVPPAEQQPNEELKRVHTSVARIEHDGKGFTLVGPSLFTLLRFVLAFFGWHRAVSLILDWFHVVKKFKDLLSMAMRG